MTLDVPSSTSPRRPYLLYLATAVGIVFVVAGVGGMLSRFLFTQPPKVETAGLDPAVAKAIELTRQRVMRDSNSGAAWGFFGMVLQAHSFPAEAFLVYERAAQLDPKESRWPYLMFEVRRATDPEATLPHLQRAVELSGNVLSPRLVLGEYLLERGQLDEAKGYFERVVELNPPNPRAHLGLGRIAAARGEMDASMDHLSRAAQAAPNVRQIHTALAEVYHRRGDKGSAEKELRRASELPDAHAWPNPYLKEVTDVWVGYRARISWATELENRGQAQEAVQVLRALQRDYSNQSRVHLALGQTLNRLGEARSAEQALRQAVKIDPTNSNAQFQLGYALQQQGKDDEAADCYRRAVQVQPALAMAHYGLGTILAKRGDTAGAADALRESLRHRPDFADAHLQLGRLLIQQGNYADALEQLTEASQLGAPEESLRELKAQAAARSPKSTQSAARSTKVSERDVKSGATIAK
jgi:tetratricopeptide (TPR) repeat protein